MGRSYDPPNCGQKCEARVWREKYRKGQKEVTVHDGLDADNGDPDEDATFAIFIREIFDDKNDLTKKTLQVNSPYLLEVFRTLVVSYPTVASRFTEPFVIESPFQMLHHYWDELHAHRRDIKGDTARMHLSLLLDFMKLEMGADKTHCESMIRKGQINFAQLWTIFRPEELVYFECNKYPWLLRLDKTAYGKNIEEGEYLEIQCSHPDYDGTTAGYAILKMHICRKDYFEGQHPATITDLCVFPRKFHVHADNLEKVLVARASRLLAMQGVFVKYYDGLAEFLNEPPRGWYRPKMDRYQGVWMPYHETGRVVIDRKTFQEENRLERVSIRSLNGLKSDLNAERHLYPPYTYGYSIAKKNWCRFYVDNITEVEWKMDSFDSLVLQLDEKSMLQALVSSHQFPVNARDQSQQKGKGLVILLHGSPGSGKTLTAELSAESTKKALLSATMGDLNRDNSPSDFEKQLKSLLQYATMWNAIVLLDEADVFLEAREGYSKDSSTRNALVAVFLKHLEYFSGIIFLTSNRVGVFDDAMISRIHHIIEYVTPVFDLRRLIWTQILYAIPSMDSAIDLEHVATILAQDELNGREISNVINTARTLARFENVKLHPDHIERVLSGRRRFKAKAKGSRALKRLEIHGEPDISPSRDSPVFVPASNDLTGYLTIEPKSQSCIIL